MSPKAKVKVAAAKAPAKKPATKAPAKEAKEAKSAKPAKAEKEEKAASGKKGAKAAAAAEEPAEGEPQVDAEELEEQAEEAAASGGGGNAAALAAAGSSEMSASFKNFRHHPDMENFYRFIFENDLRHEALAILDTVMAEKREKRATKGKH